MKFSRVIFVFCFSYLVLVAQTVFATIPTVTVTSPASGSQASSPVNYVAAASSPQCAKGIASIRIYTAPGFNAYTVKSNQLNANVNLAPGIYKTVVQAWDNCGGVGKTPVTITISGNRLPSPRFFFSSDFSGNKIDEFLIDPASGGLSPRPQGALLVSGNPAQMGADKGGFRLYVALAGTQQLAAYFINRNNGTLTPVPGSPFALGTSPNAITVSPSGKFVYVAGGTSFVVGFVVQSNGSLVPAQGSPFSTQGGPASLAVDPSNNFLYVADLGAGTVDAYRINKINGSLTPVPGEPYTLPTCPGCIVGGEAEVLTIDRKGNFLIVPGLFNGAINVYAIDHAVGTLTLVPGSPFINRGGSGPGPETFAATVDATNRFVYTYDAFDAKIGVFRLNETTGALTLLTHQSQPGLCGGDQIIPDPSGSTIYASSSRQQFCSAPENGAVLGLSINQSNGNLTPIPGSPFPLHEAGVGSDGMAVTP